MPGKDIRKKIDENNKVIESLLSPNQFILNNTISKLLKENRLLQEECGRHGHHYEEGYCIYCDMEEDDEFQSV